MPSFFTGFGLCVNTDQGWIEVNGVHIAQPAFHCYDLWELVMGPDLRGDNSPQPGAPGVFPNPKRWDATTYDLPIMIAGEVDPYGNPYAVNSYRGFERNVLWLRKFLELDPTGDTTVPFVYHSADGQTADAEVQPLKLIRGKMVDAADTLTGSSGLAMIGVLRILFPGGGPIFDDAFLP